jgi:FkbH-like protein
MGNLKGVKCVVWDLDNTLWDGILLESNEVTLKSGVVDIIKELDRRGILNSIASKNNHNEALQKLKAFNIDQYFLYPEINWNAKSVSIGKIQKNLNIGIDTFLFIDDQIFEREEVAFLYPEVRCVDALDYLNLLEYPELNPRFITEDSSRRRVMYLEDAYRKEEEDNYQGPQEEFLKGLNMAFIISEAQEEDLKRVKELTERTHQLNSTGITFDYDELQAFIQSENHRLLICELQDKYGTYGKIGLALATLHDDEWHLRLLLMSCRVMTRGVGSILLYYIMNECKQEGKILKADFLRTDKNKIMYLTYKFANFIETSRDDATGKIQFENDLSFIPAYPAFIDLKVPAAAAVAA